MKNLHHLSGTFIILIFLLLFSQCSLLELDVDGELSATIGVIESKEDANVSYSNSTVISADSDEDIKDNLDKIKNWTVEELSYSVRNFEGDPSTTFTGSIGFSTRSASAASISVEVSNLVIGDVSDDGKKYKLSISDADLNTMAGYFEADQAIKVYFDGLLSQGPASFDVEVFAKVKIKVDAL